MSFYGKYLHNIDSHGRISLPSKLRQSLNGELLLGKGLDGCLALYTVKEYDLFIEKIITSKSFASHEVRDVKRALARRMMPVELDSVSRITIPKDLIDELMMKGSLVITGVGDHIEIWEKNAFEVYEKKTNDSLEDILEKLDNGS
ncbi:MAG: hypothetical protein LBR37_00380 [Erysipelotrichaceae bacterium]|nr:hypothetical protein [Erysipelotrichaceae bacterium]